MNKDEYSTEFAVISKSRNAFCLWQNN